ncbi:TPA: hypothetical protein EYP66_02925 [Candidatus Poribacteria bacterium]|nr:hypothetical protein [Candidatus Poribacteria bacterium]
MRFLSPSMSCILAVSVWFCVLSAIGAEPPMWTFDDKDAEKELKSWGALNQLAPLEIEEVKDNKGEKRMVLKTKSLGGDPYMFPGGDWNTANYEPIDGTKYNILYMGIRVNLPNTWQVYYYSKQEPAWNENQRQNYEVKSVDDFEDIEVEITRGGWDKRDGIRFRIDPGTAQGVEAEIDYISFTGPPNPVESVQPEGNIAVTWGNLKNNNY